LKEGGKKIGIDKKKKGKSCAIDKELKAASGHLVISLVHFL
jgi:hypothetical protein